VICNRALAQIVYLKTGCMNLAELEQKLIAVARSRPINDAVPYAFTNRIMANLKPQTIDEWSLWARALWRATAPCVTVMLVLAGWSLFAPTNTAPGIDLSQQFENTVLAAADQEQSAD
jgi:hypothetical protein